MGSAALAASLAPRRLVVHLATGLKGVATWPPTLLTAEDAARLLSSMLENLAKIFNFNLIRREGKCQIAVQVKVFASPEMIEIIEVLLLKAAIQFLLQRKDDRNRSTPFVAIPIFYTPRISD